MIFCNCKNILSYTVVIPMLVMLKHKMDDQASITLNGIGLIFGLMGVVAIFIQQSLTMFLPLLLPLVVCVVFCTLLINSQRDAKQIEENTTPSPVRIDLIWYPGFRSWLLRRRFLFRHFLCECFWFESLNRLVILSFLTLLDLQLRGISPDFLSIIWEEASQQNRRTKYS